MRKLLLKINTRVLYKIFDKYLLTLYVCVYMFVCIFWCSLHVCVLMSYISLSLSYHWQANTRGVQFTSINRRQTRIGESRVESPAACFIISLLLAFIDIRVSFSCIFWIYRFMVFFFPLLPQFYRYIVICRYRGFLLFIFLILFFPFRDI